MKECVAHTLQKGKHIDDLDIFIIASYRTFPRFVLLSMTIGNRDLSAS